MVFGGFQIITLKIHINSLGMNNDFISKRLCLFQVLKVHGELSLNTYKLFHIVIGDSKVIMIKFVVRSPSMLGWFIRMMKWM